PVLLSILTAVLSLLAHAFRLLAVLLGRDVIVWHGDSFLSIRRECDSAYQTARHDRCSQSDINLRPASGWLPRKRISRAGCWRGTASTTNPCGPCSRSRRRRWRKWSAPRDRA